MAEVNHSERAHAVLSASGSERWLNCTPSARLEEHYPEQTSPFAEEGTTAHEYAELLIKRATGVERPEVLNVEIQRIRESKWYNADFEMHVISYVNYVLHLMQYAKDIDPNAIICTEIRLNYSSYVQDGEGTVDFAGVAAQRGVIADLKFGKGVKKEAKNNTQLMLYALGLYSLCPDILSFTLIIHQPRIDNISTWEISTYDLLKWAEETLKPKAKVAFAGTGDLNIGEWCRFCKAKRDCNALITEFEVLDDVVNGRKTLTKDVMQRALRNGAMVKSFISSIHEQALQDALNGNPPEGYKAVEGKSSRTFTNIREVEARLKESGLPDHVLYKQELIPLTAIEKALGKKTFAIGLGDLISYKQSRPTLVSIDDERSVISNANEFEDLDA